ncbi:V-type ATP synthase subunit I, partial [Chloroflexota bacterium]
AEVIYTRPFSELGNEVVPLYTRLTNLQQKTSTPGQELKRLTELKKYLEPLAQHTNPSLMELNFSGHYLFSRVFLLPGEVYEGLQNQLKDYLLGSTVTAVENETVFYGIGRVEDQKTIESMVTEAGGKVLQIPAEETTLLEFIKASKDSIRNLEQELSKLNEELLNETKNNLERLVLIREVLLAENERLMVLEKASEAKYVTLIEGWIPESNAEAAISELRDSIDNIFIDTREPEPLEDPPTKLRNPKGVKPFQVIVNMFATPKYREWDPTPIIAYSFASFFGLMVGDVIYGLGTILIARFLLRKFTDNPQSEGFKLFQRLIYISSSVAIIVGVLSGTYLGDLFNYFGIGNLALITEVQEALQTPITFIMLALAIGFIHVNIGHTLALIRGIKQKIKGVVPGEIGIFLLQIGGIPYLAHNLLGIDIPLLTAQAYTILSYILLGSIVLIIIASIIQKGAFLGSLFWLFDVTGLLGDVMSYARIAGVGLATYYLAFCFNLIANLFSSMIPGTVGLILGTIVAIIILLIGHMLNLVLSGLTGFIHSLRLCFVEFLFKFYEGGGREYSPFKLKTRESVIIGAKS